MSSEALVSFRRLSRSFRIRKSAQDAFLAVRDVSLDVMPGKTLGVVGESGCGKSTLGRMAVGLLEPSGGDVLIEGQSLYNKAAHADYVAFRRALAGSIQMVFQDPYSSLNPRMRIGTSIEEALLCSATAGTSPVQTLRRKDNELIPKKRGLRHSFLKERVARMLEQVGLEASAALRYPHEFSGGQRQRIAIARALISSPAFVVCDEPTSSLDASVQSQVLNLLQDMQKALGLTYMFISHDLAVVRHMSDQTAVMYKGLLVESGDSEELFSNPLHPYTRLLLESVPGVEAATRRQGEPQGQEQEFVPENAAQSAPEHPGQAAFSARGCPFVPRCPVVRESCRAALPELVRVNGGTATAPNEGCPAKDGRSSLADCREELRRSSRLVRCRHCQ